MTAGSERLTITFQSRTFAFDLMSRDNWKLSMCGTAYCFAFNYRLQKVSACRGTRRWQVGFEQRKRMRPDASRNDRVVPCRLTTYASRRNSFNSCTSASILSYFWCVILIRMMIVGTILCAWLRCNSRERRKKPFRCIFHRWGWRMMFLGCLRVQLGSVECRMSKRNHSHRLFYHWSNLTGKCVWEREKSWCLLSTENIGLSFQHDRARLVHAEETSASWLIPKRSWTRSFVYFDVPIALNEEDVDSKLCWERRSDHPTFSFFERNDVGLPMDGGSELMRSL